MLKQLWKNIRSLAKPKNRRQSSTDSLFKNETKRFCNLNQVKPQNTTSICSTSSSTSNRLDPDKFNKFSSNEEEKLPLPYHAYNPVRFTAIAELPVCYWFHIFLYSNDLIRLLAPFTKLSSESMPKDRRLVCIMNRCKVRIFLDKLELFKSLPRYVMVLQGVSWEAVVRALIELEDVFPAMMRFASHPMLMDVNTYRFACTNFRNTALQTRMTGMGQL